MAQLTITIPDEHLPRVVTAFEEMFGRGYQETDAEMARRGIAQLIRRTVLRAEDRIARKQARQTSAPVDAIVDEPVAPPIDPNQVTP